MINTAQDTSITRPYRVEVDGKTLIVINQAPVKDIRQLMAQKFGAGRIGAIVPIGVPGSREAS